MQMSCPAAVLLRACLPGPCARLDRPPACLSASLQGRRTPGRGWSGCEGVCRADGRCEGHGGGWHQDLDGPLKGEWLWWPLFCPACLPGLTACFACQPAGGLNLAGVLISVHSRVCVQVSYAIKQAALAAAAAGTGSPAGGSSRKRARSQNGAAAAAGGAGSGSEAEDKPPVVCLEKPSPGVGWGWEACAGNSLALPRLVACC
jgi:hypothetical protein